MKAETDNSLLPQSKAHEPLPDVRDCGLMSYAQALSLQMELCRMRYEDQAPNTVLIVEHPSVITLGARQSENKVLLSEEQLQHRDIELVQIRRGGGATAHNPGQLVFYPILKLRSLDLGVTDYIRRLESIGMELLQTVGVTADRRKGFPGLWIGPRKIASIGVQVKRWVTLHGMAININNDLSIFQAIVPCGIDGVQMTSVETDTGQKADMDQLKATLADLCRKVWVKNTDE
ncbi:MAG: lipoyl(octanoyl) transferase LipB [Sedimentisphaerales bacterium]|nr:lipoyl(octanoyl) transferase LipB [Sedimentisphaerales bacterium]